VRNPGSACGNSISVPVTASPYPSTYTLAVPQTGAAHRPWAR
jgi:hypothetical protein